MIEDYETIDAINERLDELSDRVFHSVEAAEDAIDSILENFDVDFEGGLDAEEDNIFEVKCSGDMDTDLFLYVVLDREMVGYSMYAQILEEEDIQDIQDGYDPIDPLSSPYLTRVRHSADD